MRSVLPAVAPVVVAPAETDKLSTHWTEEEQELFHSLTGMDILQAWLEYFIVHFVFNIHTDSSYS